MKIRQLPLTAASRGDLVIALVADGAVDAGAKLQAAAKAADASGDLKTSFRAASLFHQPPKSICKRLAFVGLGKQNGVD
ncbi:MAG: hypothetical protein ABIP94_07625, partial [Planctomycetota bacterium]